MPDKVRDTRCEVQEACPVQGACGGGQRAPCVDMVEAHLDKLRLCEELEAVADALPDRVDRLKCLRIAADLLPLLRRSHRYEEQVIFPVFAGDPLSRTMRERTVRRLEAEHVEDECAAQDVTDALLSIGRGEAVANPEALGFMLRAFFETLRRHVAFERDHVLPSIGTTGINPS